MYDSGIKGEGGQTHWLAKYGGDAEPAWLRSEMNYMEFLNS